MTSRNADHVAGQLQEQGRACRVMGSPLYGALLDAAAEDCLRRGPVWNVLSQHVLPGRGNAVALRFMSAVHRLVLTRRAPGLALHYPSVGGTATHDAVPAFLAAVEEHIDTLIDLVALPCQTNEVGRCAPLVWGFFHVAEATGLPLRCLEVGASAGLNLRWDAYRYGRGESSWGPIASPVDLTGLWHDVPAAVPAVRVIERRGCDLAPLDPLTSEGRLALSASVWPDMIDRFARLRGALQVAERIPAAVDEAGADVWLEAQLAELPRGVTTVVFHSVVLEYFPPQVLEGFHAVLSEAAGRATKASPLVWVSLEPVSELRRHAVSVTLWPGGKTRYLATSGPHGQDVTAVPEERSVETAAALATEARRLRATDSLDLF